MINLVLSGVSCIGNIRAQLEFWSLTSRQEWLQRVRNYWQEREGERESER